MVFSLRKNSVPFLIFLGGAFIAAVVFIFSDFSALNQDSAVASQQWTQAVGAGVAVPACTSSASLATCDSSDPNLTSVTVSWSYNGEHGPCTGAVVAFTEVLAPGPANSRMAYGVINNRLYIAQGSQLGTAGRYYDPAADSWSPIANAPVAFGGPASAVVNNRLYSIQDQTLEYNPVADTWNSRAAPPVNLVWGQAAVVSNRIYVFKGASAYEYNPSTDLWSPLAPPPRNHGDWPAVAQVGGVIYVIGGGNNPYTNAVDAYNPLTNSWEQKADIPAPAGYKGYASAAAYNGKIYVFGGGHWDSSTRETWEYDPDFNTWTRKSDGPTLRNVPAVGVIGSKIYVYGGEYPGAYLSAIHAYDPSLGGYPANVIAACPPYTNSYTWTGGRSNTSYNYFVTINLEGGGSDVSAGSFTTPTCPRTSATPFCSGSQSGVTVKWDGTGLAGNSSFGCIRKGSLPWIWTGYTCTGTKGGNQCGVSGENTFYNISGEPLEAGATYSYTAKTTTCPTCGGTGCGWDQLIGEGTFVPLSCAPSQPPSATNLAVSQPDYCVSGPAGLFSWQFTDPDAGDTQSAYQVQVDNNSGFSSPEDDSGKVISSSQNYATPLGRLSYNTTYYWRLMVWDSGDLASSWISGPSFTTPLHAYPSIDFSWIPLRPAQGEQVQFTDQSTVFGGSTKSAWAWTFQDGAPSSSSVQNATTTFISDGSKTVSLRVTDSDGYACRDSKIVNITLPLPEWREIPPF